VSFEKLSGGGFKLSPNSTLELYNEMQNEKYNVAVVFTVVFF